jgi:competence protein ComGF
MTVKHSRHSVRHRNWQIFTETSREVRTGFTAVQQDELQKMIDQSVDDVFFTIYISDEYYARQSRQGKLTRS